MSIEDNHAEEAPRRRLPTGRRAFLAAAGFALIIVLGLLIYLNLPKPTLYEQYAQHPTLSLTQMSGAGADPAGAEAAFNAGDYEAAADRLESYLQQNPTDTMALVFRGISLLETERFGEAAGIFSTVSAGDSDFRDLATWYLALTYLRQDQPDSAREILSIIPPEADQYSRAQELLRKLE